MNPRLKVLTTVFALLAAACGPATRPGDEGTDAGNDGGVPAPPGMALVPAGVFNMGCNSAVDTDCDDDEGPVHAVTLSAFYMDVTEVTQAAYKACVDAGQCTVSGSKWNPTTTPTKPVVGVDWDQSKAYCTWAGKRLPTEAEWEKAARGTDGRVYPWGNQTPTCQYTVMKENGYGCGTGDAMVVGSKPAGDSPYGLHDMAGNVWEWVADYYGTYPSAAAQDPQGPSQGAPPRVSRRRLEQRLAVVLSRRHPQRERGRRLVRRPRFPLCARGSSLIPLMAPELLVAPIPALLSELLGDASAARRFFIF